MSNIYENINSLCQSKGVTPSRMCIDIGAQPSLMGDLKSGRKKGMSAKMADKIANYFGVSVSYILGNDEQKKMPTIMSDSEQELLELFRSADSSVRQLVLMALRSAGQDQ